jgi:hypothetical protein
MNTQHKFWIVSGFADHTEVGQSSQYKRVSRYLSGETLHKRTSGPVTTSERPVAREEHKVLLRQAVTSTKSRLSVTEPTVCGLRLRSNCSLILQKAGPTVRRHGLPVLQRINSRVQLQLEVGPTRWI